MEAVSAEHLGAPADPNFGKSFPPPQRDGDTFLLQQPVSAGERLAIIARRAVSLGSDAIVLTLASPILLVFFAVRALKKSPQASAGLSDDTPNVEL